jgi:hypothetical protein
MTYHTKATYRQGAFFPEIPVNLPEDSQVDLVVQGPSVVPPAVTDAEERCRILRRVTDRMRRNRLPADCPKLSRDQLHERR